ncbi:MAG: DUF1127 domain-containing protein [Alphaproteobacteria bacterium]|nr:DUF1127 domain-containing protein [Alphaproteobacteria bacterium]
MNKIHSIDTDSFALTGASASPANTSVATGEFLSELDVLRIVATSRAERNVYIATMIANGVKSVAGKIAKWNRTRTKRHALVGLNNHLLRDIGLERAAINEYLVASKSNFITRGFLGLTNTVVKWNNARLTQSALHRLTDAQLNDIGMIRHDIDFLARDIRTGRVATPTTTHKAAADKAPRTKPTVQIVRPVNSNLVSSWFISPRRAA